MCHFCAIDILEQPHSELQNPSNHRHYPMIFISVHQTQISQFCQKQQIFKHTKLYQCLVFVGGTKDANTPPTIGTTLCFQVWMSEEIFLQTQISQFWPNTLVQSIQVVPMPCICQFHHRCNHPKNHWHYPMVCEFAGLNNYWQLSEAPRFCPEVRPAAIYPPLPRHPRHPQPSL